MSTVLARRIIAVSPDGAFRQQLAAALEATPGAFDVVPVLEALGTGESAGLYVIHLDGALARAPQELVPYLPGTCPVIAVLPRPDLAAALALMESSARVAGVLAAEGFDAYRLAAMATRIVTDDVFGLDRAMAPGTEIYGQMIGDHQAKALFLLNMSEFMEQIGVPRRHRPSIEQCLDEMLMNALYDAPVDAQGKHIFEGIPARIRVTLRSDQSVSVQYACDGKHLGVAVRDAFGSLDRQTVLRHLHKGLHAEQKVDRKAGGAGLGLYLMASSSTAAHFHVLPGIATEALCLFDLEAPRLLPEQLGFLVQRSMTGQHAVGAARRLPAAPRSRLRVLVAAGAAAAVLAGAAVLVRRRGGGGASEDAPAAPAVATVELDSQPTGAAVEIDGAAVGSTPLTLTTLAPGATVSISFKRLGYRAATARLEVPRVGDRKQLVQPLQLSEDFVRVRFVSNPPGAEVTRTGRPATTDHTYTPAEVFVEANMAQYFTLIMPGHVPLVIEPFTPARGTRALEKGGDLVEGANLRVEGAPGGKITIAGAPHCKDVAVPFDCVLAPGTYGIEYRGPGNAKVTRKVTMESRDAIERF